MAIEFPVIDAYPKIKFVILSTLGGAWVIGILCLLPLFGTTGIGLVQSLILLEMIPASSSCLIS